MATTSAPPFPPAAPPSPPPPPARAPPPPIPPPPPAPAGPATASSPAATALGDVEFLSGAPVVRSRPFAGRSDSPADLKRIRERGSGQADGQAEPESRDEQTADDLHGDLPLAPSTVRMVGARWQP